MAGTGAVGGGSLGACSLGACSLGACSLGACAAGDGPTSGGHALGLRKGGDSGGAEAYGIAGGMASVLGGINALRGGRSGIAAPEGGGVVSGITIGAGGLTVARSAAGSRNVCSGDSSPGLGGASTGPVGSGGMGRGSTIRVATVAAGAVDSSTIRGSGRSPPLACSYRTLTWPVSASSASPPTRSPAPPRPGSGKSFAGSSKSRGTGGGERSLPGIPAFWAVAAGRQPAASRAASARVAA